MSVPTTGGFREPVPRRGADLGRDVPQVLQGRASLDRSVAAALGSRKAGGAWLSALVTCPSEIRALGVRPGICAVRSPEAISHGPQWGAMGWPRAGPGPSSRAPTNSDITHLLVQACQDCSLDTAKPQVWGCCVKVATEAPRLKMGPRPDKLLLSGKYRKLKMYLTCLSYQTSQPGLAYLRHAQLGEIMAQ